MAERVRVYYEGWGERWLWGTLVSTKAIAGRSVARNAVHSRMPGLQRSPLAAQGRALSIPAL